MKRNDTVVLFEVSYRPDRSAPNGMKDVTVFPSSFTCDLSVVNEHFQTVDTSFEQDGETYMLIMDTRPEWHGDIFARHQPYVDRRYNI